MEDKIKIYLTSFSVILFILTRPFSCFSQFSDSVHYHTQYNSSGSINKADGNSAYLLANALKLNLKKKAVSMNLGGNWLYGKQNQDLTNNDFSSSFDFNLYKTIPHFFYWGLANYNTSHSLRINNQLLTGAGVAYNIYDRPDAFLNVSNGVLFDVSDIINADSLQENYQTFRNSFRLVFKFVIKDLITISGSNFVQNSFRDGQDYNIRLTEELAVKLNRWVSLTAAFTYNRINRTRSENLFLSYGITFERYF